MIGQFLSFITRIETAVREEWGLRAAFYAMVAVAILLTWSFTGGESVAFVYSEF